jgi:hypothetical protein
MIMGLADQAGRAARKQAKDAQQVAAEAVEQARAEQLAWVTEHTGLDNVRFAGDRELALGEYRGDDPVCTSRTFPIFGLDDVFVAYDRRSKELYLLCVDENLGEYLGPRVFMPVHPKYTKAQRRKNLVAALGRAMNTAAPHPVLVLREANAACPTCGREW